MPVSFFFNEFWLLSFEVELYSLIFLRVRQEKNASDDIGKMSEDSSSDEDWCLELGAVLYDNVFSV